MIFSRSNKAKRRLMDPGYRDAIQQLARRFLDDELSKATPSWLRDEIARLSVLHQVSGTELFDDLVRGVTRNWIRLPFPLLMRDAGDKLARIARIIGYLIWQRSYGYRRPAPRVFETVETIERVPSTGHGPKVSVVVLSFNRLAYLKTTLAALHATAGYRNFEIIIVDNGSTDGSVEYLLSLHAAGKIDKLLLSDRNLGTSIGYNHGFAYADPGSAFLMKLDSDITTLRDGWLQEIVDFFAADPGLGLVALTVQNHPGLRNMRVITRGHRRVQPMWYGIMGAAGFTFRREMIERIGYFNEDFDYAYMPDDIDYVYRVIAEGFDAYYLADFPAFERRDQDRARYFSYERMKKAKPPMGLMRAYFGGEKSTRIFYRRYENVKSTAGSAVIELKSELALADAGVVSA